MTDATKPNVPESVITAVEQYLLEHATDDTVTTSEIAEAVDLRSDHDTNPPVREVVQYLVLSGRLCVDGSGNGYTVATTEAQRDDAIRSLRDHVGTLNRRIQALKGATLAHEVDTDDGTDQPDAVSADGTEHETDEQTTVCDGPQCSVEVPRSDWRYVDGRDSPVCPRCYGRWLMDGQSFESVATDGGESR